MTRRTTRTTHPGAVLRSSRGAHGYTGGVTPDALSDPTPVFPPRPVVAPASATSPLKAGPDTVAASGSVSATDGTTTVDPATSLQFPAGTLVDLGGGAAGVGLLMQMLGPVRFNFGDLTESVPATVAALPAGSLLFRAFVIVRTTWSVNDSGGRLFRIDVLGTTPPDSAPHGSWWVDDNNAAAWPLNGFSTEYIRGMEPTAPGRPGPIVFCDDDCTLTVTWQDVNALSTAPTTGAADIYAIIATPAG